MLRLVVVVVLLLRSNAFACSEKERWISLTNKELETFSRLDPVLMDVVKQILAPLDTKCLTHSLQHIKEAKVTDTKIRAQMLVKRQLSRSCSCGSKPNCAAPRLVTANAKVKCTKLEVLASYIE